MQTSTVHKACDLLPDQRQAIESLLGRPLQEDEAVEVNVAAPFRHPAQPADYHVNAVPVWPGRVIGELRRDDIYDDVG